MTNRAEELRQIAEYKGTPSDVVYTLWQAAKEMDRMSARIKELEMASLNAPQT